MKNIYYFLSKNKGEILISRKIWKNDKRDNKRYNLNNHFEHFEDAFLALQEYGDRPKTTVIPD